MMYDNREIEILAYILNVVNNCINSGEMDNGYIDIKIETIGINTHIFLVMDYSDASYKHRQTLSKLETYIINHSNNYDKQPTEKYNNLIVENSVYGISNTFYITVSWLYDLDEYKNLL